MVPPPRTGLPGCKFRRQHPIGSYVVDFCCPESGVVVEVDGGQHGDQRHQDDRRTRELERRGFRVLRFWNTEVFANLDGVLQRIVEHLRLPHPRRLPKGSRER
ncbi:MAG: endonuclease domain-containing protein [Armatimonadota bacterium]|nr:endonuclease domain-containing protein [Armatimonadota bacterium]